MLDIKVTIEGDKVIIEGLNNLSSALMPAVLRGMEKSTRGIYSAAYDFLSGAGAKGITTGAAYSDIKTRKLKIKGQKWTPQSIPAGGYPVPVRKGHLRRMLDWLKPGYSKTGEAGTFTAGPDEFVIYDAAIYANIIHEGYWTSTAHGPRRYLTDALERYNQGERIKKDVEEEIQEEIKKEGMA